MAGSHSLERRLVLRLMGFQAIVVVLIVAGLFASGVLMSFRSEENTIETLRGAVTRGPGDQLALRPTRELQRMRLQIPELWFVIRDRAGQRLSEGAVPSEYSALGEALDQIGQARLGWNIGDPPRPTARVRWVRSAAGDIQVVTGTETPISTYLMVLGIALVLLKEVLPVLAVMAAAALLVTPWVVRSALAGLGQAVTQAQRIDVERRGVRLPLENVPVEVEPLVSAVNAALARLDKGHERHKRFLAAAAHELRTPIAILQTRLEALPLGPDKTRLLQDVTRLATVTEQLLDLERLDQQAASFARLDLVTLAQRVVVNLAPLAFLAGYQVEFTSRSETIAVWGDGPSIERALTNLVQNAIEHGGRSGSIAVRVDVAMIEVSDEGSGIPPDERERIFEPFSRLRSQSRGLGLGLNLVREIMHRHGGEVIALDAASGGACLRMTFPQRMPAA
ncbi:sensor histidine kinase [Bosea sp. NPDC055332]